MKTINRPLERIKPEFVTVALESAASIIMAIEELDPLHRSAFLWDCSVGEAGVLSGIADAFRYADRNRRLEELASRLVGECRFFDGRQVVEELGDAEPWISIRRACWDVIHAIDETRTPHSAPSLSGTAWSESLGHDSSSRPARGSPPRPRAGRRAVSGRTAMPTGPGPRVGRRLGSFRPAPARPVTFVTTQLKGHEPWRHRRPDRIQGRDGRRRRRLRPSPRLVDLAFQTQVATPCPLAPNRQRDVFSRNRR